MGDNQSSGVNFNDAPALNNDTSVAPTSLTGVPPFIYQKEKSPRPQLPVPPEFPIMTPGYQNPKFDDFSTGNSKDPIQRPQHGETYSTRAETFYPTQLINSKTNSILVSSLPLRSLLAVDGFLNSAEKTFVSMILSQARYQKSNMSSQLIFSDEHGDNLIRIMLPTTGDSTLKSLLEKLSAKKIRVIQEFHPGLSEKFKTFYQKLYCINVYSK